MEPSLRDSSLALKEHKDTLCSKKMELVDDTCEAILVATLEEEKHLDGA